MSDIRNEHANIESVQYFYRSSNILSMTQVENEALAPHSVCPPPLYTR